jgi:hypothetical protein
MDARLEFGIAQVGARGLQSVQKKTGGFGFDLSDEDETHDLHDGHLNGVGVFEDGQDEGGDGVAAAIGGEADALVLKTLVKETETVAAQ